MSYELVRLLIACCLFLIPSCSLIHPKTFNKTMRDNRLRLFFSLLLFQPGHIAVVSRGKAHLFFKKNTEGADAFKTYFIAYFSNWLIFRQQVPRFVQSLPGKVLMGSTPVYPRE